MPTPHCEKHKRFIPSCKECNHLRSTFLGSMVANQKKGTAPPNPNRTVSAPCDKDGNPLLVNKYEQLTVSLSMQKTIYIMLEDMEKLGYEFYTQISNVGSNIILIFKRKEDL